MISVFAAWVVGMVYGWTCRYDMKDYKWWVGMVIIVICLITIMETSK